MTAVYLIVGLSTAWKLFSERYRLSKDELTDDDRALAWQVVFFVIFPLINVVDLRATAVASNLLGGFVKSWSYGLLWYQIEPSGIQSSLVVPVLLAGPLAAISLALLLIPPLFFRPHPFLASLLGYASLFILTIHLIVNPILFLSGATNGIWEQIAAASSKVILGELLLLHALLALIFIFIARSHPLRMWFSELTRPVATKQLKEALITFSDQSQSDKNICWVALLYDHAGLRGEAIKNLKRLKEKYPESLYTALLESVIAYRQRNYKISKTLFLGASDRRGVDGVLKANLLAAAACSSFAAGDVIGALNLCERALEFDNACLVGRMVKVDVFLRQGKKEQAGDEIMTAMRLGLTTDLEKKIPLDVERTFLEIAQLNDRNTIRQLQESLRNS